MRKEEGGKVGGFLGEERSVARGLKLEVGGWSGGCSGCDVAHREGKMKIRFGRCIDVNVDVVEASHKIYIYI